MNEEQFFGSAIGLAKRTLAVEGKDATKLNVAFERLASRPCTEQELQMLLVGLQSFRKHYQNKPESETLAWTMVMNSLLNLDIVKNKQ